MFPVEVFSESHREEYLELVRRTLDEIRAEAEKKQELDPKKDEIRMSIGLFSWSFLSF